MVARLYICFLLFVIIATISTASEAQQQKEFQLLATQAAALYKAGKFAEAEDGYLKALQSGIELKATPDFTALLNCNLAAACRQQQKNTDAEKYFAAAIEICRANELKTQICEYVAQQYAGLLRRQGKEFEADLLISNASSGFSYKPEVSKQQAEFPSTVPSMLQTPGAVNSFINPESKIQSSQNSTQVPVSSSDEPTLLTGTEEHEINALVRSDATNNLENMAQREPGQSTWKILSDHPRITKLSPGNYEALIKVNFCTITTDGTKLDMNAYWSYIIQRKTANQFEITSTNKTFRGEDCFVTKPKQ